MKVVKKSKHEHNLKVMHFHVMPRIFIGIIKIFSKALFSNLTDFLIDRKDFFQKINK